LKRVLAIAAVMCTLALMVPAQFGSAVSAAKKPESQVRSLTGLVLDKSDAPMKNAVVYLKNTKTLTVNTFITGADGQYRFPALSPNIDYEVYAEHNGRKSDTKTLSSFDMRSHARIVLRIQ